MAAGDPFVTSEQLANALQLATSDLNADAAAEVLIRACDAVRDEVGQLLDVVTDDTIIVHARDGLLILPELPVTDVSVVAYLPAGTDPVTITDFEWTDAGIITPSWGRWQPGGRFSVVYSHGYADMPRAAVRVGLQVAARAYTNPEQLLSAQTGALQQGYGSSLGRSLFGLTDDEKRTLDPLRP